MVHQMQSSSMRAPCVGGKQRWYYECLNDSVTSRLISPVLNSLNINHAHVTYFIRSISSSRLMSYSLRNKFCIIMYESSRVYHVGACVNQLSAVLFINNTIITSCVFFELVCFELGLFENYSIVGTFPTHMWLMIWK